MADNVTVNSVPVATRSVTYSGDASQNVQAVAVVTVAGSDDAKTATDLSSTNPLPTAPYPASVALTAATWTSATALNTNLDIVTEGVGTLRISITSNTAASGNLRLYRDTEAMPMFITDQAINDGWFRYGQADSYAINGTTGDIYVNPGGASKIQLRLTSTISSGSVTLTPYVSAVPFVGPTGIKAEDAASQNGDFGMPMLFVRKATPANTSGADGDYEFGQISGGRQWVSALIDAALPAGTNAIGKLAANTGVDIGAVEQALVAYAGLSTFSNVFSTTQTSVNLVAGTASQRIYVPRLVIATGGTTAGRVSIYWGTGAFTAGTSPTLFDGEFAPSTTSRPGCVIVAQIPPGGASAAADNLRITTSAAITVYVTLDWFKA